MSAAGAARKSWKLQEISAHTGEVTCLALGHNSGHVMVTGGDDQRVNLWALGKPNCIMSLTGHTSPVESVRFKDSEELVMAGSQSGSLKIWNLEAAKLVRTLTGHQVGVRGLDFHPYGEFVASGSLDKSVKIWDLRRKGCLMTYKGHAGCVNCVRFSPDGRWVASAGGDGSARIWDLAAGKLLHSFTAHTDAVNTVEFHPSEYLLATGSADRTVRFWDLEKFTQVSCTDGQAMPVRSVLFGVDGSCLYSGSQDLLCVLGWEPARVLDLQPVEWGSPADLATLANQLIGASFTKNVVSVYVVDLSRLNRSGLGKPYELPSPVPVQSRGNYSRPSPHCVDKQASEVKRDKEECRASSTGEDERPEDSAAEITTEADYERIFKSRPLLMRSLPQASEPFPAPAEEVAVITVAQGHTKHENSNLLNRKPVQHAKHKGNETCPKQHPSNRVEKSEVSNKNIPRGLQASDFMQHHTVTEEDVVARARRGHKKVCSVLASRHKKLELVRSIWSTGDIKTAMETAVGMKDPCLFVDALNVLNHNPTLWKLDICLLILPHQEILLCSKHESYMQTGCATLKLILQNFGDIIKTNMKASPSVGVDITREERYKKCFECMGLLQSLRPLLDRQAQLAGRIGVTFRELLLLMMTLD
uniref:katanin p80 WD40 repeat-containing subunit B1 n=1 Tax=Myxine glutinosa TaxID=7769 RepID=UPI00358F0A82